MFKNKKSEQCIPVNLEEPLTGYACSQLIIEIVKYILYQKQQIPLSYDSLVKFHANTKPCDRNFSSMQCLVDTLENVSNNLASQFTIDGCEVKEILIIIGATIISPKVCIRFELPSNLLSSKIHTDYQHSFRKPLMNVMRSILECIDFQDEMTLPLKPTNTFVLLQKKDPNKISEFFIPKPQFKLSTNVSSFCIKFNCNETNENSCNCENFIQVYQDSFSTNDSHTNFQYQSQVQYQWYQSKKVFKGFKFLR